MNHSFKKRLLYIFSNKKAQSIEDIGGGQAAQIYKVLIFILLGIILGYFLMRAVLPNLKFTP